MREIGKLMKTFGLLGSVAIAACINLISVTSLVHAGWDASGVTIAEYTDSPQRACEYIGIWRGTGIRPYRLAWVLQGADDGGFYRTGFDVQGPLMPNPENNYTPPTLYSGMVCILDESYVFRMSYRENFQRLEVALTGPSETRPAGTGGTSEITLTAKVTEGTTPKAGVALSFTVDVTENSGGHEHHSDARPKGTLSGTQGTTDANGEVKIIFKAPEFAGIHTVKAICASCSGSPATKEVKVRVPDLLPISPSPPQNEDGSFIYALTSVDKIHEGSGRYHKNQYWLTDESRKSLRSLVDNFQAQGWGTVALNDASMFWGGRYDISGNWGGSHHGHRDGREIDISFTRARNPISATKQNVFYKKFCEEKGVEASFTILHHFVAVPHFHVYLTKQKSCNRTES